MSHSTFVMPTDLKATADAIRKALAAREKEVSSVQYASLGIYLDALEQEMLASNPDMDREKLRDELLAL